MCHIHIWFMIAKLVNIYKYKISAAYSGRYVKTSCVCSANLEEGGTTNRGGAVPSDSGFACGASKVSFFNSWVRLEVKKPRWGSSNKCYPVIQKNGWFELKKNYSNWWFKCPPIWGNLRIRRDYSRESLAYPGGFGGKQTSMISAISIPLVLDACFAKNLGSLNEYSWPLVNGYQPPLYSPHQVLNSFQFLDPCSIPTLKKKTYLWCLFILRTYRRYIRCTQTRIQFFFGYL